MTNGRKVLEVDGGGTHIKLLATGQKQVHDRMWEYERAPITCWVATR